MLVKELIEKLKSLPLESQVVIEYTDHTDYHYVVPMNESEVRFEKEMWGENTDWEDIKYIEDEDDENEGEPIAPWNDVVVITFSES
jgi:hypothetical protein